MLKFILGVLGSKKYSSSENIHGNYSQGRHDSSGMWYKD